jgi:hypothetical protein
MSGMAVSRWAGLQNVETVHRADPVTFSIPRSDRPIGSSHWSVVIASMTVRFLSRRVAFGRTPLIPAVGSC